MFPATFTGLDLIARCIDAAAGRIGYLVLERPNGRHENVRVARVNLDAESLREFMPSTFGLAMRQQGVFAAPSSVLAEAAVAWLRHHMEQSMGLATEATFKVNAWQHKGLALEFAPRVTAHREFGGAGAARAALATRALVTDPLDVCAWLLVCATTRGCANINEEIARAEGRPADAEREAAVARACLQIALTLCGYGEHAATLGPPPANVLAVMSQAG